MSWSASSKTAALHAWLRAIYSSSGSWLCGLQSLVGQCSTHMTQSSWNRELLWLALQFKDFKIVIDRAVFNLFIFMCRYFFFIICVKCNTCDFVLDIIPSGCILYRIGIIKVYTVTYNIWLSIHTLWKQFGVSWYLFSSDIYLLTKSIDCDFELILHFVCYIVKILVIKF